MRMCSTSPKYVGSIEETSGGFFFVESRSESLHGEGWYGCSCVVIPNGSWT